MRTAFPAGLALALALTLGACGGPAPAPPDVFHAPVRNQQVAFVDAGQLAELDALANAPLQLGPGDQLKVNVWGRPELSASHVLGPDGKISMPLAGSLRLGGLSRDEANAALARALAKFYVRPVIDVTVEQYVSNRVTVLGRVQNPGVIRFDGPPSLLEALARAGSLPVIDKQATLTRCAVFRGKSVIWVDLKHLLARSDARYNIALRPNDLIYIPDSNDTSVYVLGAVARPGAYRLTPDMTVLDALAQAGGPNEDGAAQQMMLYRANRQAARPLRLSDLIGPDGRANVAVEEGDTIFVPKSGLAEVGYTLRQLLPGLSFLTFGASAVTTPK